MQLRIIILKITIASHFFFLKMIIPLLALHAFQNIKIALVSNLAITEFIKKMIRKKLRQQFCLEIKLPRTQRTSKT